MSETGKKTLQLRWVYSAKGTSQAASLPPVTQSQTDVSCDQHKGVFGHKTFLPLTIDQEEESSGFIGHCTSNQGFTSARGTIQQYPTGRLRARRGWVSKLILNLEPEGYLENASEL